MNEDPKRIWVDHTILCEFDMELCPESDVKYVRADLVDALVEALKICLAGNGYDFDERPAEAALKGLEEE